MIKKTILKKNLSQFGLIFQTRDLGPEVKLTLYKKNLEKQ